MAVDWSELPPELLGTIADKLNLLKDRIRFRAVCTNWRFSTPETPINLPCQIPWLMLPADRSSDKESRGFFSLWNNKINSLALPQISRRSRRCGSSHGWLAILEESPEMFLLNPLSKSVINLPPLHWFPNVVNFDYSKVGREYTLKTTDGDVYTCNLKEMRDSFIKKVILSGSPASGSGYIVLAIINQTGDLAYCKNGVSSWKFIEDAQGYCEDAVYFKGMFYTVNKHGEIAVCDVNGNTPRVSFINTPHQVGGDMQYLVACKDDLLLVTRYLELEFDGDSNQLDIIYRTTEFQVSRLDLKGSKWEVLTSLDDQVLFLGENSSLGLSASDFPECKGNHILRMIIQSGIMMVLTGIMIWVFTTWKMGVSRLCHVIHAIRTHNAVGLRLFGLLRIHVSIILTEDIFVGIKAQKGTLAYCGRYDVSALHSGKSS